MKSHKYSLFKSNRSQASLLSNQSFQERGGSYQPSPIDSPLHSPAFPPPSVASSPLSPDDKDKDDALARTYEADATKFHQSNHHGRNVLQRSQSQRTPSSPQATLGPTINLVSPTPTPGGSPRIDEDPDTSYRLAQENSVKGELKKKRRFLGLGGSSSEKEAANTPPPSSPRGLGRSISVRRTAPQPDILTTSGPYNVQQQWPSGSTSARFSSPTVDEEPEGGDSLESPYEHFTARTPDLPPKDPPKSPLFAPSQGQEHIYHETLPQYSNTASSQSQITEQTGLRTSAWDRSGRPSNHNRNPSADIAPQYKAFNPAPSSASSSSSHPLPSRSVQDVAYPQPLFSQSSRPSSRQSQSHDPPSPSYNQISQFHQRTTSSQTGSVYPENTMVPPPSQQHTANRSQEFGQQNSQQSLTRAEAYQAYAQGSQSTQGGNQPGVQIGQYGSQLGVNNNQQSGNYRNTPQASPMVQQNSNSEPGRNTPPPSRSRDDLSGLDVQQLLARHDELNDKYRKVKKYYFDKDAQVQQLQNTLAHQRLAQSRTSLDDNEYATRFSRLDGAINNLAFNIRKDWRHVPPWLAPYVNKDATTMVTKEMTAVGRACITRWIVDELLDRHFHPALEPTLSCHLKIIEKNLRRYAPPTPTEEEREALLAKISNWRLATLDGLQDMLASHDATIFRAELTKDLVIRLTEDLTLNLRDPAPPGLDAGVLGIIELAVGIAANLPLESRDVFVDYVMPGTPVNDNYMKVEGQLPALTNPGESFSDTQSIGSGDEKDETDRESLKDVSTQQQQQQAHQQAQQQQQHNKKKTGMLSGLMGKKPVAATPPGSSRGGANAPAEGPPQAMKEERVRFAAFMSVEVRGKNMLIKAPVYI